MFSRKNKAERTAARAWDYLSSAMVAAGESARDAGRHTADVAGRTSTQLADTASKKSAKLVGTASKRSAKVADKAGKKSAKLVDTAGRRVKPAADEAWARANAAANALAGRKPGLPWGVIVGASLIGVALGWAAASSARVALERQAAAEERELAETAVVVTPSYDA
jgi:hypothetical protein